MVRILIKPLYTEKVTKMSTDEKDPKYGFVVDFNANKIEIAKAVEKKYSVEVESVKTIKYKGKIKSQFRKSGRYSGSTARYKKAYVTLKKDQTINLYEQV
ncbi:MAG: hypothetical protein AMXMBFR48_08830 [Ignavibacteriales bacterium]